MTQKEKALKKTIDRFTNLIDGKVNPKYTIHQIIDFYEKCIEDETYKDTLEVYLKEDNIMQAFVEAKLDEDIDRYWEELGEG